MPGLPKLKIKYSWSTAEEVHDFEQGESILSFFARSGNMIVAVEGEVINSYEELVRLAAQDPYKDREYLQVNIMQLMEGG